MPENEKDEKKDPINHDDLEAGLEEHEEERLENELDEQLDLNQGMSTGTYSETKSGVNWPASYRGKLEPAKKKTD